jgi:peptidoglycan hydrolase CwlO-like protein
MENFDITAALRKSIEYENAKTFNLLNHNRQNLSEAIEEFNESINKIQHKIESLEDLIEHAEDLSEGLEAKWHKDLAEYRKKLETRIAWRTLFLSAWKTVKH